MIPKSFCFDQLPRLSFKRAKEASCPDPTVSACRQLPWPVGWIGQSARASYRYQPWSSL
ncbi:hypothetical protein B0T18DRAFT_411860 [Schizothecium vesticola]|uniref:Uncharacterized protein n=1 Tax=Schizothecium vesticola TaxID=314040 RepID=A0AA40EVW2_9PEZI|nr:hypothetical protein B0T18DRAFT_411860 [Schizothecium vesticola]